ncbi:MAG: hypothetical protein JST89_20595 [Cyanobacteria bacterium SZAS-4]|nr:hypothetical protein [Cyanobacteria bacterium SZAS-4]
MDSNRKKSSWRLIQEKCKSATNGYEKCRILLEAILVIQKECGKTAPEMIYPYQKFLEMLHDLGEYDRVAPHLPLYYLVLELNYTESPERLLLAVEKMREQGYTSEALNACCRLVYLLYESPGVKKQLFDDAWYLLEEMHKVHPDVNAKKLLKYLVKKDL